MDTAKYNLCYLVLRMMFEPIAVMFYLGMILFLLRRDYRKQSNVLYNLLLLSAMLVLIASRTFIRMSSRRYSIVLILPGVIFAAYACFALIDWQFLKKRFPLVVNGIAILLVGILVSASAVKFLRFNKYSRYIQEVCAAVRKDAAARKSPTIVAENPKRFCWYSKVRDHAPLLDRYTSTDLPPSRWLPELVQSMRFDDRTFYILLREDAKNRFVPAKDLGMKEENWQLIAWQYTNSSRKHRLTAYRFVPDRPSVVIDEDHAPASADSRILSNGDFEAMRSEKETLDALKAADLAFVPGMRWPTFWAPTGKVLHRGDQSFRLTGERPISGKYSLKVSTSVPFSFSYVPMLPTGKPFEFKFRVRGTPGTRFSVRLIYRLPDAKLTPTSEYANFILRDGRTRSYSLAIAPDPAKYSQVGLLFFLYSGEMLLDDCDIEYPDNGAGNHDS